MLTMNPTVEMTMRIKAIAGFVMFGRDPVVEGEEIEVPNTLGRELIHSLKAVRVLDAPKVVSDPPKDPPKEAPKELPDSTRKSKS